MTDVLILHRIPGLRAGRIVPIDDRLRGHVAAGNAVILPNAHDGFGPEPEHPVDPSVLVLVGSDDHDEDTDPEG